MVDKVGFSEKLHMIYKQSAFLSDKVGFSGQKTTLSTDKVGLSDKPDSSGKTHIICLRR